MLTTRRIFLALSAVFLSLLVFAAAALAAGPTVKVRIVGESSTLLPLTTVTLEQPEPASGCSADSATAAINLAVDGDWDHGEAEGGGGDFTKTILGETEEYSNNSAAWAVWINDKWAGGICEDILSEGDELLLIADHEPPPSYDPTVLPLVFAESPSTAVAGVSFKVVVDKVHTRTGEVAIGEGDPEPEQGVTVSAGGSTATTGSDGSATLTIPSAGTYTLTASEAGAAPTAPVSICVRASNQSGCGVTVTTGSATPGSSISTSTSTSTSTPGGIVTPYKGPYALVPSLTSLADGRVYSRRSAPRVLAGTVLTHSAVNLVNMELRREYRRRCSTYDGTSDLFVKARCGTGDLFKASNGGAFSYLLPAALAPGRYVLDVQATDVAGNHSTLARGSSRIVFYVR